MELNLATDQRLFLSTVAEFAEKTMSVQHVRELAASGANFDRGWWSRAADLGWTSLLAPEEAGGGTLSGEGLVDLTLVAEQLGRTAAPGPLLATNVVVAGLVAAGAAGPHAESLAGLMAGEVIATWAVYAPGRAFDPQHPGVTARGDGAGYILCGSADRVEVADSAELFLVTATSETGPSQFLVPADRPGLGVRASTSLDAVRHFGELHFDDVAVSPAALVGAAGRAGAAIERQLQVALVLQSAETVGAITRVLDFTVQWAFDRYAFGRPLASYQALKHRFADMKTWVEASAAITAAAARAVQRGDADAGLLASAAKSYVGAKAPEIVQDCVQLHGGIGVTWEHDLHLYLRRVTVNRSLYGTPEQHRQRVTDLLETAEVAA
jgi:alkylation response protein AidB-like acyl-CoA dehydrogenase